MTSRFYAALALPVVAGLLSPLAIAGHAAEAVPPAVANVLGDAGRPPWEVGRDHDRHPGEILAFSQIKPGMVVVDLVPGDGYYTRLLSKLVGPRGKVYALVPQGALGGARDSRQMLREGKLPAAVPADEGAQCAVGCYPTGAPPYTIAVDQVLAIQNIEEYKNITVYWEDLGAYGGNMGVPEQVDVVFSSNGYHQLHYQKRAETPQTVPGRGGGAFKPLDVPAVDKAIFRAVKPGGSFIVIDRSAAKGVGFTVADSLHRSEADAAKAEIVSAGFTFDGESHVLANPADDLTKAAGGLYAVRDKNDQFAMRFKKPMAGPNTDKRPSPAEEAAIMKNYYGNTFIGRADMTALDTKTGNRTRFHYYSPDHSYQEFGRLGEGPGPMQAGVWFWDADGHNCQLHQYPLDERANTVCHVDVQPDAGFPFDVLSDGLYGNSKAKVTFKKGHILQAPKP